MGESKENHSLSSHTEDVRTASRYAIILFFLSILLLIATAFLNNTLAETRELSEQLWDQYENASEMLARSRAIQTRDPSFFTALMLGVLIENWHNYTSERVPIPGRKGAYALRPTKLAGFDTLDVRLDFGTGKLVEFESHWDVIYEGIPDNLVNDPSLKEITEAAKGFGKRVAEVDHLDSSPEEKRRLLEKAVAESFRDPDARKILKEVALDHLSRPATHPDERRNALCWVVSSEWPCRGRFWGYSPFKVSYTNRFDRGLTDWDEEAYLLRLLQSQKDVTEVESVLLSRWKEAHVRVAEFRPPLTQMSLPGTGLSLTTEDLLMAAGPLLIFFQVMLLIFKERIAEHENGSQAFYFPQFASPDDPLDRPLSYRLSELAQRSVWFLFLALPILILACGSLTRYDLVNIIYQLRDASPGFRPLLINNLSFRFRDDLLSSLLDTVNLGCLAISLLAAIRLSTLHRSKKIALSGSVSRLLFWLSAFFIAALLIVAQLSLVPEQSPWALDVGFFTAYGSLWVIGFTVSLVRGTKAIALISLMGILITVLIFLG